MIRKRLFDFICSIVGLIVLSPLLLIVGMWIKVDSKGPVFFRQERVGKHGELFRIYKFRTMVEDAECKGTQVTTSVDARITKAGNILRKYKIDELPQLINVALGQMSIVGPRPEVPKYVAYYQVKDKEIVLSVSPGITDNASILYKNENELLSKATDPERFYIERILPEKINKYREYVENRKLWLDVKIIFKTLIEIFRK